MKSLYSFLFLAFSITLLANSCKKEKTGIDALPAATQEGKNTFGCLVNGKAFLPKATIFTSLEKISCYYGYINGGYSFILSGNNNTHKPIVSIHLNTDSLALQENFIYQLKSTGVKGQASGEYMLISNGIINNYSIIPPLAGELKITRFDEPNRIISGAFWFDAVNDKGEKVEIREGRFDVKY